MSKQSLCQAIGYTFRDESLLDLALTHSSYANEAELEKWKSNERLEFLGDAVFDAVIGEYLYRALPEVEEGKLTRLRALIVCENSLAERALAIRLGDEITFGRSELLGGGCMRTSIVADGMEAVLGAIFLDGGWDEVKRVILANFFPTVEAAIQGKLNKDYKTAVQEYFQQQGDADLHYDLLDEQGPDHCKTFTMGLYKDGKLLGTGVGRTKKEAEQNAARETIKNYSK